ncbi:MAG: D-hexose-6-phosphate mutarotase [Sulfuricurvum sp.]|nr:D-hexose-6-phosphate mutarotase [Sulfuricurvum sp.]
MEIATPDILNISHPLCRATILLQGAQLISWIPSGASEVLWSSDISHYSSDKAFRGGIPICWPWFGKAFFPSHGFARLIPWELISRDDSNSGVHLEFRLSDSPKTREIWPHPFTLTLQIHLGSTCEIQLNIDAPVPTTGALHTYLTTSDISHSTVSGLGDYYIDSLQKNTHVTTVESTLQIHSEVDRIYTHPQSENTLTTPKKTLQLSHQGQSDVVVWNPWIERSAEIADMEANDYRHMLCIETARISKPLFPSDTIGLAIKI